MCFPFPSQHKLQQTHREQTEKLCRACFSFDGCTVSYWDCSCWKLKALLFPLPVREVLTSQATLPERLHNHNNTVSIRLLRYHQLSKNSLNSVILKYFLLCSVLTPLHFLMHLCCISPRAREQAKMHVSPQATCSVRSCLQTFCQENLAESRPEKVQLSPLWPLCPEEFWRKERISIYCICVYSVCTQQALARGALIPGHCSGNRSEIYQKLGGKAILTAAAMGRGPGQGRSFRTTGHCRSSMCVSIQVYVFISAGPRHRTNAWKNTPLSAPHNTHPSTGKQVPSLPCSHPIDLFSSELVLQRCFLWDWLPLVSSNTN